MNNNLPSVIKNNLFKRIAIFFKGLFKKTDIENNFTIKENIKIEKTDTFISDLKKSVQENNNKLDIISKIEENPDLIYSLSNERLEQLIQLYDEQIAIVDNDIFQITNNIKKLESNN